MERKYYPKIQSLYKRDPKTNRIIEGDFSLPEFEYLQTLKWHATEKIDGTNVFLEYTITEKGADLFIGGRTEKTKHPDYLMAKLTSIAESINIFELIENLKPGQVVTIFGEGYGNKIQAVGNGYLKDKVDFIVFDIRINNYWLPYSEILKVASKANLKVVPNLGEYTLSQACKLMQIGFPSLIAENKIMMAEGMILRPVVPLFTSRGERITVKIKYKDFNNEA